MKIINPNLGPQIRIDGLITILSKKLGYSKSTIRRYINVLTQKVTANIVKNVAPKLMNAIKNSLSKRYGRIYLNKEEIVNNTSDLYVAMLFGRYELSDRGWQKIGQFWQGLKIEHPYTETTIKKRVKEYEDYYKELVEEKYDEYFDIKLIRYYYRPLNNKDNKIPPIKAIKQKKRK